MECYYTPDFDLMTLAALVYGPEVTNGETEDVGNTFVDYDCYSPEVSLSTDDESSLDYQSNLVEEFSDEHLFQRLHTMGMVEADGTSLDVSPTIQTQTKIEPVPIPTKIEPVPILPKPEPNLMQKLGLVETVHSIAEKVKLKTGNRKRKAECLDEDGQKETRNEKRRRKHSEPAPVVLVHRCTQTLLVPVDPNEGKTNTLPDPLLQKRLFEYLTKRNLPQWHVAKALNTNPTLVSNWMNNQTRVHGWEYFESPLRTFLDYVTQINL